MKAKILVIAGILILVMALSAAAAESINYPIQELGGCKDKEDCKVYCDKPENSDACLGFAQKNNLMSEQEVKTAKRFLNGQINGPGGCKSKDSCEEYCNDISKIDECVSFAENNNLLPAAELEEVKKVQAAIARGVKPPSCGNKKSCDAYCDDPSHMEECIAFGLQAGFIQGKEAEDAQKMLQAVKKGVTPPPCKGKEACDEYCSNPDNMEVCMNFAMAAGMMSEQEKAGAQKMLQAIKKGVKPPPCRGKEECDAYCQEENHMDECINFSVAAGMMSEQDAEMARKTGGKGPGGCKSKEECDAFCNNPDNQETCFNFARDNGMIPEEDLKQMEEGKQKMKEALSSAPAEVIDCLNSKFGADIVEKMKNGFMPSKDSADKMQECFQKMGGPGGPNGTQRPNGGNPPCQSPEECKALQEKCQNTPDDPTCKGFMQNFQPGPGEINPGGQMMPPQAGPGGCKTPEECQQYCQQNPDECKNFGSGPENQQGTAPNQMPPCRGENCPPPANQQPQEQQCQGENCQFGPQPGQEFQPLQNIQPPNSTEPGAGGGMTPGNTAPLPSAEQQPPSNEMPPPQNFSPPPAPTSFLINQDSLVASAAGAFINFLLGR